MYTKVPLTSISGSSGKFNHHVKESDLPERADEQTIPDTMGATSCNPCVFKSTYDLASPELLGP
eukprot:973836-Amphidinium_carterae.1